MEENINIADILKDKPDGISLYSSVFGSCVYRYNCDNCIEVVTNNCYYFNEKGHYITNGVKSENGECLLFPSNEMRDWSKFAWKKGDVLVSEGMGRLNHVIFEGFDDDTYLTFKGKHYLCNYDDNEDYNEEEYNDYHKELILRTIEFKKDNVNDAKAYINTIEERYGGKLNLETLEIEKQSEFKDGDIITITPQIEDNLIFIFRAEDVEKYYCHAFLDGNIAIVNDDSYCKKDFCTARPSTEEEQKQLFDALAKKGKAWDAEKKAIVNLKPKCEFKPFDRCIWKIRNCEGSIWQASFVSYVDEYDAIPIGVPINEDLVNLIILPYNEETAKLIGTTKDVYK